VNREFAQPTVDGYFDGELDAMRSAEFERHLETCLECQAELRDLEILRGQLRESDLFEPASPQLRDRIRKQITQEGNAERAKLLSARRLFLIPAFCAVAATTASLGVLLFVFQPPNQSARITVELIDAHVRSLQPGHLTDVLSSDQQTVKPWFDGKLDFIPPVSDFSQEGFPLVGGRLDFVDSHNVASLVYSRGKHFISLFLWHYREMGTNPAGSGLHQGYNWLTWQSGEIRFCLISDASATDLRQLKDLIRQ
jgi:anti-sigma factor RsiW